MQMLIHIMGGGVGIPKTDFSATFAVGAWIGFRAAEGHPVTSFAIGNTASLGMKGRTLVASTVKTKWISIDAASNPWVSDINGLIGQTGEIHIKGTLWGKDGRVDLIFNKIDEDNITTNLAKRENVKAWGYQLTETKIRGEIMLNKREYLESQKAG